MSGFVAGSRNPVVLREIADQAGLADAGKLYTRDIAARTELFYTDSDGADVQITSGGLVNSPSGAPGDHGGLTGLADDDHTQYALLAGRAGTANDLTLRTDGTGILRGSAAAGGGLDLVATSSATDGAIRFFTDPTTEIARFTDAGEFLVGLTSPLFSEIVGFSKAQNSNTTVRAANTLDGTASQVLFTLSGVSGRSGSIRLTSPSFTPSGSIEANQVTLEASGTGAPSIKIKTIGASPIIFTTTDVDRARFLSTGQFLINKTTQTNSGQLEVSGKIFGSGELEIDGALNHDGTTAGFLGATPVAVQTVAALTDNSGGTADNTIAAAGAIYDQADENNNRADVAAKINEIRTALVNFGLLN